jgi:hypothetical protein
VLISIATKPGQRDELRKLWDAHPRARVEGNAAQELYLETGSTVGQTAPLLNLGALDHELGG